MTPQEKKAQQDKNQAVINTGRGAYRMMIHISGNPHSKQPYRDLWEKGWRLERRKEEGQRPQAPRPPQNKPDTTEAQTPRPDRKPRTAAPTKFQKRQGPKPSAPPQPATGVITDRLINRFNRRHQTQV